MTNLLPLFLIGLCIGAFFSGGDVPHAVILIMVAIWIFVMDLLNVYLKSKREKR